MVKTQSMSLERQDGARLLLVGSAIFILFGIALEWISPLRMIDFKTIFYGARCVQLHRDPYLEREYLSVYQAVGGSLPSDPVAARGILSSVPVCVYPPSALFLVAPFARMPWSVAQALWMLLTAIGLPLAALLVWQVSAQYTARVPAALAFLILANSELLLVLGNAAGIVVSLCVIAVCCFMRGQFTRVGVVCLAVAILLKPQDAAFLWFYFLLAGGVQRKRALQAGAVALTLGIVAALWVGQVSPHWIGEMQPNLAALSAHGGLNDPGAASTGRYGLDMVVSLQALFSVFRDDPHFYNLLSILVSSLLLLGWTAKMLRGGASPRQAWLAIAAIVALSMLPVYHRAHDARLLLLTLPACAQLWTRRSASRWWAVGLTGAAILCTGDLSVCVAILVMRSSAPTLVHLPAHAAITMVMLAAPLSLLAVSIFYLWIYMRTAAEPVDA